MQSSLSIRPNTAHMDRGRDSICWQRMPLSSKREGRRRHRAHSVCTACDRPNTWLAEETAGQREPVQRVTQRPSWQCPTINTIVMPLVPWIDDDVCTLISGAPELHWPRRQISSAMWPSFLPGTAPILPGNCHGSRTHWTHLNQAAVPPASFTLASSAWRLPLRGTRPAPYQGP